MEGISWCIIQFMHRQWVEHSPRYYTHTHTRTQHERMVWHSNHRQNTVHTCFLSLLLTQRYSYSPTHTNTHTYSLQQEAWANSKCMCMPWHLIYVFPILHNVHNVNLAHLDLIMQPVISLHIYVDNPWCSLFFFFFLIIAVYSMWCNYDEQKLASKVSYLSDICNWQGVWYLENKLADPLARLKTCKMQYKTARIITRGWI